VLHLLNLEEIEALLLKVSPLVKRFEDRDPDFVAAVRGWLAAAEEMLGNNRMPVASEIAVYRGALISAERGFVDGLAPKSRSGARHLKEARAANLLKRATDTVVEAIRPRRAQVDEAERLMMQIVAVADRVGLVPPELGQSHTAYLQKILQEISNRAELTSLLVHVTGLLGNTDTLIMLDRAIGSIKR
jgi:hypothetical protein